MLPQRAASICSGVAFGFLSNAARIETTNPGVQNPHCWASFSANAAGTGSSRPMPSDSAVLTSAPRASIASVVHEYTVRPLSMTVQAPHVPRSHTRLQPVTSRWLRSASRSVTRGSTLVVTFLPFTVSSTATAPGPAPGVTTGFDWAAAGGTSSPVSPATAAAALVPVRKPRRETPPRGSPWESFMTHDPQRKEELGPARDSKPAHRPEQAPGLRNFAPGPRTIMSRILFALHRLLTRRGYHSLWPRRRDEL